jgi:hypothetical protein
MKAGFIKQGFSSTFTTWESLLWSGPERLLHAFRFKSKLFSLLVEWQADIWVVSGGTKLGGTFCSDFSQKILSKHKAVPIDIVPWDEYDVVISVLPFIPKEIIRAHPKILWAYLSIGHVSKLHRQSLDKVQGSYDLFLDHSSVGRGLKTLPQAISFPFPTNRNLLRKLIQPMNESAVFLDTRLVKKEPLWWFRKRCNLPIRCSPQPATNGRRILAGRFTRTKEYLEMLGSCKYFLVSKKQNSIGQAALEAAALGLIVVSGPGVYPNVLCHPRCLTAPNNPRQGLNVIKKIEKDTELQREILAHQDGVLSSNFWKGPLATLHKALEMKRNRCQS